MGKKVILLWKETHITVERNSYYGGKESHIVTIILLSVIDKINKYFTLINKLIKNKNKISKIQNFNEAQNNSESEQIIIDKERK